MKILIIQLAKLGDIFQSAYSLNKLRRIFPDCKIYFLCSSLFRESLNFLEVDEIIPLNLDEIAQKSNGKISLSDNEKTRKILAEINKNNFDIVINLNISELAEKIFHRIKSHKKYGYYSKDTESQEWLYFVLSFIKTRKLDSINLVDVYRHSFLLEQSQKIIQKQVFNSDKIVCFALGTRNRKRNWEISNFVKLAELFSQEGYKIHLIGSKSEKENAKKFFEIYDGKYQIENLIGKTNISQLVQIISKSSLIISGDTGPMHIASYLRIPVLAIFLGPAYPFETAGYFSENKFPVIENNLECYPCGDDSFCNYNYLCHNKLSADFVFNVFHNKENFYKPVYDEIGQFLLYDKNKSPDFVMKLFYRDFALRYFFDSSLDFEKYQKYFTKEAYKKCLSQLNRELKIFSITKKESFDSNYLQPFYYLKKLLPNSKINSELYKYLIEISK